MNRNMLVNSLQVLGMGVVLAVSAIAHASPERAPAVEVRQLSVKYADLDIAKPADAQRLYTRIEGAARNACGHVDTRDLRALPAWRSCRAKAVSDAVAAVGSEQLASVHRARLQVPAEAAPVVADTRGAAKPAG